MPLTRYNKKLLLFFTAGGIFSFLTSLVTLQLFFGIIFLLWLFEKNSEKKKAFDTTGALFLVFAAARIISIFLSPYPHESYQALYKDLLFYLSFFSLAFYFRVFNDDEKKLVYIFIAAAFTIVALIGITRFNLGIVKRAESFGSGYATYSTYLLAGTGFIMSLYEYIFKKRTILFSIIVSFLAAGIITSLGRFNIALLVIIFIAGIILFRVNYKAVLLIVILSSVFSYMSFLNNSQEAEERVKSPATLSDRDILYQGAAAIWSERPVFGFGPRTFQQIFPYHERLTDKGIGSWHNDFLQIYFESGFLGLAAFIVLLVFVIWRGIRFILINKQVNSYIIKGIILVFAGIILSSLTAGFINSPVLSVQFSFFAALVSALTIQRIQTDK